MLPLIWTLMVLAVVAGFVMIVAYWLDVQDRPDLAPRAKIGWSAAIVVFPVSIPAYAFFGGGGWPLPLRLASLIPGAALALFLGFVLDILG